MRRALVLTLALLSLGGFLVPRLKRALRRLLRRMIQLFLRLRGRPLPLDAAPTLVIAPHQDDGTLGCGGLVFQKRLAGQPVHVLYLTDGSASHRDHPTLDPRSLAARRRAEARLAKARLYLDPACLDFLDLPDGRLPHLSAAEKDDAITRIAAHLARVSPATILLPWRRDGSTEHEAGFELVVAACERLRLRPRLLEYPVWANYRPLLLLRPALHAHRVHRFDFSGYGALKRHALAAYSSQFEPVPPWTRPVLSAEFAESFDGEQEFFFEIKP